MAARVAERFRNAPSYGDVPAASAARAGAVEVVDVNRSAPSSEVPPPEYDVFSDPFFTEPHARSFAHEPSVSTGASLTDFAPVSVEHHMPVPEHVAVLRSAASPGGPRPFVEASAEAVVPPAQSLPARLIEFPRELVAVRKQRPRLAEGPLLDPEQASRLRVAEAAEAELEAAGATMEAAVPSAPSMMDPRQPAPASEPTRQRGGFLHGSPPATRVNEPAWGAIRLGEHPEPEATAPLRAAQAEAMPALTGLAPISDRLMAALVDGCIVFSAFLLSVFVFASCTAHVPSGKVAIALAGAALAVLAAFYGWLFMSFGGGSTPGMRYARIALCTFQDENPNRRELRGRVPATALALLPLGLGVLWALLDENRLGWHDRMTRTYQRTYR